MYVETVPVPPPGAGGDGDGDDDGGSRSRVDRGEGWVRFKRCKERKKGTRRQEERERER